MVIKIIKSGTEIMQINMKFLIYCLVLHIILNLIYVNLTILYSIPDSGEFFHHSPSSKSSSSSSQSTSTTAKSRTDSSDSEYEDRFRGSPHTPRKRKIRQQKRHGSSNDRNTLTTGSDNSDALDELAYVDTLPEVS